MANDFSGNPWLIDSPAEPFISDSEIVWVVAVVMTLVNLINGRKPL